MTFIVILVPTNRKDVRLPTQLQRAMAAEAEAARDARAKVITCGFGVIYWKLVKVQSTVRDDLRAIMPHKS